MDIVTLHPWWVCLKIFSDSRGKGVIILEFSCCRNYGCHSVLVNIDHEWGDTKSNYLKAKGIFVHCNNSIMKAKCHGSIAFQLRKQKASKLAHVCIFTLCAHFPLCFLLCLLMNDGGTDMYIFKSSYYVWTRESWRQVYG